MSVRERWSESQVAQLRELYEGLRRFAAVVGRWDLEPDDLVQEAYTRVLRVEPDSIENLGAYLRRTIVNVATNERRRARRAVSLAQRLRADETAPSDAYPSELADLMRIDPKVRGLLYLVEIEGEQTERAAPVVGMSAAAGRMALSRARRRLRAEVGTETHGE